jgi:uncharacterized FlaG/YvyC family protein
MELRFPLGTANTISFASNSQNVKNVKAERFAPVEQKSANYEKEKQERKDVLWVENLLSAGDRGLKFKKIEDVGIYQLQVIDKNNGKVIRKVPPDEMLKIITHLRDRVLEESWLSNHLDVFA